MFYDAELAFTRKIIENFRLKTSIVTKDFINTSELDMGLRKHLGLEQDYENSLLFLKDLLHSNSLYKYTDIFHCTYIFFKLPDTSIDTVMIIGPYTTTQITKNTLMEFAEKMSISPQIFVTLEKYFNNIPYLETDTPLFVLLNTFGEKIWGSMENFTFETIEQEAVPERISSVVHGMVYEKNDALLNMQALENRYETENSFLKAISQGLIHKADLILNSMSSSYFEMRASDPIRNMQNYSIILNTLLRKAAEDGMVHPLYIDRLSSDFGRKIETITSTAGAQKLQREMIHKYCLLVKNHSMKGYSLLVQKAITCIDSDLTADLTLNAIAKTLNVNASYLSNLFKKETGSTLTEYVNEKRIQYAIFLLQSTTLQIQTIAQYCGVPDVNYFTKMFKKKTGKPPKEYRDVFLFGSKQI